MLIETKSIISCHIVFVVIVTHTTPSPLSHVYPPTDECNDYYELMLGVCGQVPEYAKKYFHEVYHAVTLGTCFKLCSGPRGHFCSGVFFDFEMSVCHVVSYSGRGAIPVDEEECVGIPQLFIRHRCVSK